MHQKRRKEGHLDVIEPLETPLYLRVGETVLYSLSDLALDKDWLVLVNELNHVASERLCGESCICRRVQALIDRFHFSGVLL